MRDDGLRVILGGRSEDVDLEEVAHLLQEGQTVGPDVESDPLLAPLDGNLPGFIAPHRVDQRLVQVQHQELLLAL